jgi:hypothetical protein
MGGLHPTSVSAAVAGGVAMGTLHVVTGADHISAVASLAVGNSPSRAFALGARWGAGHSVGLLCVFLFLLALRVETDEAFMRVASRWMGLGVGAFMVALGVYGVLEVDQRLRDAERDGDALPDADDPERARLVSHASKKNDDEDATVSDDEKTKRRGMNAEFGDHSKDGRKPSSFLTGSLAVLAGVVHGAAGPGAVLGVLPAMALRDEPLVIGYFCGFIVATVLAMGLFAAGWGAGTRALGERGGERVKRGLAMCSSVLCVVVGIAWAAFSVTGVRMD